MPPRRSSSATLDPAASRPADSPSADHAGTGSSVAPSRKLGRPCGSVDRNGRALRVPLRAYAHDHVALVIGEAIRRARESQDVAASELAAAIDVGTSAVLAYERGARLAPLHQLWRIAAALGVRLDSIVGEIQ